MIAQGSSLAAAGQRCCYRATPALDTSFLVKCKKKGGLKGRTGVVVARHQCSVGCFREAVEAHSKSICLAGTRDS